ncbi:MAG: non-lysosomal glucosylceramidase, partial [Clostridia bacterium]|nr:non-lysosomal glucosylceramidase [Clostridia bacterium]
MERLGRWYPREAAQAKFLLGGIGTGNVSIGPRGQLCDWELMNSPGKGVKIPYTFFALRTRAREETAVRILESEFVPPYECSHGIGSNDSGGIPRFRDSRLRAAVSRAEIELFDNTLPVDVRIEAFSPFIPLDAVSSGMPSFVLRYRVRNTTSAPIEASVCGCLTNPVGRTGDSLFFRMETDGHAVNTHRVEDGLEGIWYASDLPETHLLAGNMALVTTARAGVSVKPRWKRGGWWDGTHDFWNDFISDGMLESEDTGAAEAWGDDKQTYELKTGAVCVKKRLDSGQTQVFEFIISWFFPNRPSNWCGHIFNLCTDKDRQNTIRNFYATQWENAWQAARALNDDMARLERTTDLFIDTLMHSTLPAPLIEAAEANITVLRSTTCFRIEDGTLLGWEGCFPHCGSCEGSCTHVWNYAQTPAFLFPELERSMRRAEYLLETDETGAMAYRGYQALGGPRCDILLPAADGQMGSIIRLYRDWKLSGDDDFLRSLWDKVVLSIEFAMKYWDTDGDLLFDARQRNTYDIEFYGGNPFTQTLFIGALKACGQMARALGDARAVRYDALYQRAAQSMDEALWNGEYYQQKMEGLEGYKYQFGAGCLSDALFGQLLAHVAGLGYLLPEMRVKRAVSAVFRHNFIG